MHRVVPVTNVAGPERSSSNSVHSKKVREFRQPGFTLIGKSTIKLAKEKVFSSMKKVQPRQRLVKKFRHPSRLSLSYCSLNYSLLLLAHRSHQSYKAVFKDPQVCLAL